MHEVVYDAAISPASKRWLHADEGERIEAILAFHRGRKGTHPETPNPRVHAIMHLLVENQVAANDPPETKAAFERVIRAGCSRHEAIHAVGSVLAQEMYAVLKEERPFDRERTARALKVLSPEEWRGSAP